MKLFFLVTSVMLILCGCDQSISKAVVAIEHPFEAIFSSNHLTELQHGVQRQDNGKNDTTLCWSTSNHTISDRSTEIFSTDSPYSRIKTPTGFPVLFFLGNDDAAYNMTLARNAGKHGENFNLLFFSYYSDKSCPIIFKLDGVSNVIYSLNYITYVPYKALRRFSCTIDESKCDGLGWWSLFDGLWGIFVAVCESIIAIFVGVIGLITGLICHPIDSICNFIPGVFFFFWDILCAICAFFASLLEACLAIISGFGAFFKFLVTVVILFTLSFVFVRNRE